MKGLEILILLYYYFENKGLLFTTGECVTTTSSFIRLWLHETSRIYGDKLIDKKDQEIFSKTIFEQIKKTFNVRIINYKHKQQLYLGFMKVPPICIICIPNYFSLPNILF